MHASATNWYPNTFHKMRARQIQFAVEVDLAVMAAQN